ncbi:unnamed protein product [Sphagnum balticum]
MHTAHSIAIACGIIDKEDEQPMEGRIIEGHEFRAQGNWQSMWSSVRVLARAQPADKYNLVKGIIDSNISRNREVVAVTGDGTNDAPALRKADVGFAMYIQVPTIPTHRKRRRRDCGVHGRMRNRGVTFEGEIPMGITSGRHLRIGAPPSQHFTIVFNAFVMMTLFNEINARKIHGERNVFSVVITISSMCGINEENDDVPQSNGNVVIPADDSECGGDAGETTKRIRRPGNVSRIRRLLHMHIVMPVDIFNGTQHVTHDSNVAYVVTKKAEKHQPVKIQKHAKSAAKPGKQTKKKPAKCTDMKQTNRKLNKCGKRQK